jgi:GNAT superfamily N-acetyltransferase
MTVETQAAVHQATAQEEPELASTLAAAFADDPVFSWLLPHERSREQRLRRFFTIELRHVGLPRGTVWNCDELRGAAICMPPDAWRLPSRVALAQVPAFARVFRRRLLIATTLQAAMELRHERRAHWYILAVGVRPEHQGHGLGSALLSPTLARCDRDGLPAYLEASSERSAALYERLGFEHVRELRLRDGPPLWLMLRPPAAG